MVVDNTMFGADKEKVAVHVNASGAEEDDVQVGETVVVNNDKRKLGVVGAAFLILNKMVGTGSKSPSSATDGLP